MMSTSSSNINRSFHSRILRLDPSTFCLTYSERTLPCQDSNSPRTLRDSCATHLNLDDCSLVPRASRGAEMRSKVSVEPRTKVMNDDPIILSI